MTLFTPLPISVKNRTGFTTSPLPYVSLRDEIKRQTDYYVLSARSGFRVKCHRCGGAMVQQRFYGEGGQFLGWRCIACGEIIDETILTNRETPDPNDQGKEG